MPSNLETIPRHRELCDAIVDLIDDGEEFSAPFAAEYFDNPKTALEKLDPAGKPRVCVLAGRVRRKQITRGGAMQIDYDVVLGVLVKVDPSAKDRQNRTDLAMLLADELVEYVEQNKLDGCRNIRQTDVAQYQQFSPVVLQEFNAAACERMVTYREFV